MGEVIVDVIIRPIFVVWITLARNNQKALLYFILALTGTLLIGMTCLCGKWVATKLLWPIERDIYQLRREQRAYAEEHINDTRIVVDRDNASSDKSETPAGSPRRRLSWVYIRETLV